MTDQNTQAAIEAGIALAEPFEIEGVPAVLVPKDAKVETFEELLEREQPLHIEHTVSARSPEQFISYFNRFANEESSIYVNVDNASFVGCLDHHGDTPSFQKHQVHYTCPETNEWTNWKNKDSQWMDQDEFALFLEENHLQIFKPTNDQFKPEELDVVFDKLPDAARMLEVAATLEIKSNSKILSGQNLRNGAVKFEYTEDVEGAVGAKGEFEVPVYFVIGVELFKDGKGYLILCRLKYRKIGPSIKLRYELIRPHKTHEAAVQDVIARIRDGEPDPEKDGEFIATSMANTEHIYEVVSRS